MTNILYSALECDVHPYEWVAALLSEYKALREQSGIETDDPDAESKMIFEVGSLIEEAKKNDPNIVGKHDISPTLIALQEQKIEKLEGAILNSLQWLSYPMDEYMVTQVADCLKESIYK